MFYLIACLDEGGVERSKVEGGRVFFFLLRILSILTQTHTHKGRGENVLKKLTMVYIQKGLGKKVNYLIWMFFKGGGGRIWRGLEGF